MTSNEEDKTYAIAENEEGLYQTLNGYVGENLEIRKDIAGAVVIIDPHDVPIAYVSDGKLEEDDEVRQPEQALEDAQEHLGEVMDALQDAGWTNSKLERVENLMSEVKNQRGGE